MNQDPDTKAWYTVGLGRFFTYSKWMQIFRQENSGKVNGITVTIDDYTIPFLEGGQYQHRTILEILIHGVIIAIAGGYIFMNTSKVNPIIIYVANSDSRLSDLHDLRQSITLKRIGGYRGAIYHTVDAADFNPDDDLQMISFLHMKIRDPQDRL